MTVEEIELKRKQLEESHKVIIHSEVFETPEFGQVIGFIKEPNRVLKMQCIDMYMTGRFTTAADNLLQICLIKEESDPKILSEAPEHDPIYLGFLMKANELVKYYVNAQKKS